LFEISKKSCVIEKIKYTNTGEHISIFCILYFICYNSYGYNI
jgi:hypothetical protein